MNLPSSFRLTTSSILSAALVACAGTGDPATPTVVRTAAPQAYEKTITSYLAFRIRSPQKDAEISVGTPEPGACALAGYSSSPRGWVVPVAYGTRTGPATGPVRITAKQYYFWFLGETIAGITPRIELCPGVGATFVEVAAPSPARTPAAETAPLASPTKPDVQTREEVVAPKKPAASSGKVRRTAKKAGHSRGKADAESKRRRAEGIPAR